MCRLYNCYFSTLYMNVCVCFLNLTVEIGSWIVSNCSFLLVHSRNIFETSFNERWANHISEFTRINYLGLCLQLSIFNKTHAQNHLEVSWLSKNVIIHIHCLLWNFVQLWSTSHILGGYPWECYSLTCYFHIWLFAGCVLFRLLPNNDVFKNFT